MDCKHQQRIVFNHYVLGGIIILSKDCKYKNEKDHNTIAKGGGFIV
jgi:hypothetical protein